MEYRYPRFSPRLLLEDGAFHGGPAPGERFPDFDLQTTDGRRVRLDDYVGKRPLLITLGSFT